jgi:hypothetical protein
MKIRKRVALAVLLVLSAFLGTRLGMALVARSWPDLTPRPVTDQVLHGRLGIQLDHPNTSRPGTLVVSGALQIGEPDLRPNQMVVVVRVFAPDGTVLVNETVGKCDVAKDVQQTEYPIRRVYRLPPGWYSVELLGFDLTGYHLAEDGVTMLANCGSVYPLAVN